ncbi:posterior protein-like [Bufo bufo]|uniref:posterior protein-like n=1 Tax=Bufo bufo TaxID=8384 RepID=UPI001ABE9E4C|nr:posterior protein-like [Bufo bufo]
MEFLDSYSVKSKLEFRVVSIHTNAQLWASLYSQCEEENKRIDKKLLCIDKLQKKLRNVLHMVKIFNTLVLDDRQPQNQTHSICVNNKDTHNTDTQEHLEEVDFNECLNCHILAQHIEDLEDQMETRTQLISKLRQSMETVSVLTKSGKDTGASYLPDTSPADVDEDIEAEEIKRRKLHDRAAKLNLKIHDQLMKITKDIPTYNDKMDAFHNADIFESNTDKFNLNNEQKNKVFKVWIPSHMARRLETTPRTNDEREIIHSSPADRLRQLLLFTTGESTPTFEILDMLKPTLQDDPFAFLIKFEQAYRMVMEIEDDSEPTSMITSFVKRFKYLDPVSRELALGKLSLQEAATFIDQIRRSMKQSSAKVKVVAVQKKDEKQVTNSSHLKSNPPMKGEYSKQKGKVSFHREQVTCYHCGKIGHLKWQCRKFFSETQKSGKENGFVPKAPSPEQYQSQSPYAPLI